MILHHVKSALICSLFLEKCVKLTRCHKTCLSKKLNVNNKLIYLIITLKLNELDICFKEGKINFAIKLQGDND